jgi:hypothetical protein
MGCGRVDRTVLASTSIVSDATTALRAPGSIVLAVRGVWGGSARSHHREVRAERESGARLEVGAQVAGGFGGRADASPMIGPATS